MLEKVKTVFTPKEKSGEDDLSRALQDLEKKQLSKEIKEVNRWENYKQEARGNLDDKKDQQVMTIVINTNLEVMPLIHFFLSEISSIGVKSSSECQTFAESRLRKTKYDQIKEDYTDILNLVKELKERADEESKTYKVLKEYLDKTSK